eukprot:1797675-Rhodomonas_salina.3
MHTCPYSPTSIRTLLFVCSYDQNLSSSPTACFSNPPSLFLPLPPSLPLFPSFADSCTRGLSEGGLRTVRRPDQPSQRPSRTSGSTTDSTTDSVLSLACLY